MNGRKDSTESKSPDGWMDMRMSDGDGVGENMVGGRLRGREGGRCRRRRCEEKVKEGWDYEIGCNFSLRSIPLYPNPPRSYHLAPCVRTFITLTWLYYATALCICVIIIVIMATINTGKTKKKTTKRTTMLMHWRMNECRIDRSIDRSIGRYDRFFSLCVCVCLCMDILDYVGFSSILVPNAYSKASIVQHKREKEEQRHIINYHKSFLHFFFIFYDRNRRSYYVYIYISVRRILHSNGFE